MLFFLPISALRGYIVRKTSPYQYAFLAEVRSIRVRARPRSRSRRGGYPR
jgi:hypothetical protein